MNSRIEKIISLPKSLYVSIRLCKSIKEALKIPILVRYNCILKNLKGNICFLNTPKSFQFQFGFGNVGIYDKKFERSIIEIAGNLSVKGGVIFGHGSRLCVLKNGHIEFGDNFQNRAMMKIVCGEKITFGNNVLTSWNTFIMDTDFHEYIHVDTREKSIISKKIEIGDNVWIGMESTILKGSYIANGCIIGAKSVVSGKFREENSCIAGNPAKVIKSNVTLNCYR